MIFIMKFHWIFYALGAETAFCAEIVCFFPNFGANFYSGNVSYYDKPYKLKLYGIVFSWNSGIFPGIVVYLY